MYLTDMIESEIIVVEPNKIPKQVNPLNIILQPNPCKDNLFINIKRNLSQKLELEIIDFTGKTIEKKEIHSSIVYNTSHLSKGIYMFKFVDKESLSSIAKKIVIE